jgi:transcriptional regulator with XRE-family HTH domain
MKVEDVLKRIKEIRVKKGFSQESMVLNMKKEISQVAYQKLENNKTKLTVERLFEIMEILEVSIEDVFEVKTKEQYVQNNAEGSTGFLQKKQQQIENYYQDNKEKNEQIVAQHEKIVALYEQRLQDKDKRIEEKDVLIEKLYQMLDKK